MGQQLLAVGLVLGLVIAALAILRRRSFIKIGSALATRKATRQMRVVERLTLTPHHSLHLVAIADKVLVVGVSPAGCAAIFNLSQAPIVAGSGENEP